jgi:hypothetical protein
MKHAYADYITQFGTSDLHINAVVPPLSASECGCWTLSIHLSFAMQCCRKFQKSRQY